MKDIKLKSKPLNLDSRDYLLEYLKSLGIPEDEAPIFCNTAEYIESGDTKYWDDPTTLFNIDEGAHLLVNSLNKNEKIFIQVDSDADGFTSSAIIYNYIKSNFPKADITYRLHEGKQHGVIVDTVPANIDLVIIPDAGSMQIEELTTLSKMGKKVLVLDHHEYEPAFIPNVVIINSQCPSFKNHGLSGAGVCYLFIKYVEKHCGRGNKLAYERYCDLAALGIISDVMDSKYIGNHLIIYKGLHCIRNKMFRELLIKQDFKISSTSQPSKIDVAFYITPIINGLIRSGEQSEKELFFKAMLEDPERNENEVYSSVYRGNERKETLYEYAARLAVNAKSRQDNAKKKILATLTNKIETAELDKHQLLVVPLTEAESSAINPNITGLAAMDICNIYNKPTIVLRYSKQEDGVHYSGSGRSFEHRGLMSLKEFLEESSMCDFVAGHANAFGVSVPEDKIEPLQKYADIQLADINFNDKEIFVDYFFDSVINLNMLTTFANHTFLYGNGIPEPLFAFKLSVSSSDFFVMGKDKETLKIKKNGLDFIMFKASNAIQQLQKNNFNNVIIVGEPQINEWMGRRTVQIKINDIEITEQEDNILRDLI